MRTRRAKVTSTSSSTSSTSSTSSPHFPSSPPPLLFVPYTAVDSSACVPATFVRRRDRFIADVLLIGDGDGDSDGGNGAAAAAASAPVAATAHCINPGRMEGFVREGARCWLSISKNAKARKHPYTLELIESFDAQGNSVICSCNTQRPNEIVRAFLSTRTFPGLEDCKCYTPRPLNLIIPLTRRCASLAQQGRRWCPKRASLYISMTPPPARRMSNRGENWKKLTSNQHPPPPPPPRRRRRRRLPLR
jgi:hypothetical protein